MSNSHSLLSCISFDSYIKPQLLLTCNLYFFVVYLLIPTSNHNMDDTFNGSSSVVYLLIPTSNHNNTDVYTRYGALYIF